MERHSGQSVRGGNTALVVRAVGNRGGVRFAAEVTPALRLRRGVETMGKGMHSDRAIRSDVNMQSASSVPLLLCIPGASLPSRRQHSGVDARRGLPGAQKVRGALGGAAEALRGHHTMKRARITSASSATTEDATPVPSTTSSSRELEIDDLVDSLLLCILRYLTPSPHRYNVARVSKVSLPPSFLPHPAPSPGLGLGFGAFPPYMATSVWARPPVDIQRSNLASVLVMFEQGFQRVFLASD
jgi:hypothetical protein